ncbi:MAG: M20/M25/M40 family metallo-hydrolase [Candidatus Hodarchaeales archaeon]
MNLNSHEKYNLEVVAMPVSVEMKNFVNNNEKNAINDLFKIIKIPTVTAKGSENTSAILRELEVIFSSLGFESSITNTEGLPVFTAFLDNKKPKTLLFYNHYDVQPAEPLDKWNSSPFQPEIRDGRIFGRGVADNKGEIIVRVYAMKMLQELEGEIPINIKFVIEGEEEVSSPNLPGFVENNRDFLDADACIWEFGGKNVSGKQQIWAGVKGICYVQLKTTGPKKELHSSVGAIVNNPANQMVAALASLRDDSTDKILIENYYDVIVKPSEDLMKALDNIEFDEKKQKTEWGIKNFIQGSTGRELLEKYYFDPTCTICGIWSGWQGSGGKTVLPAEAHAKIDFRLVPDQTPDRVIELLQAHFKKNGFDVEIEWYEGYPPAYTSLNDPFVTVLRDTMKDVYGHEPIIHPWSAGSGPLYLFSDLMPVLSIGVGNAGSNSHGPNENIEVEDFKLGQVCIATLISRMASNP